VIDQALSVLAPLTPLVLLLSLRVAVALAAMPAPFGDLAPVRIRAALGVLIALALAVPNAELGGAVGLDTFSILRASVGEALIGLVIGLTVRVTLAAAEIAGTIAGNAMGLGFATTVDPMYGEAALPTTRLMSALAALVFFSLHGHHVVLVALAGSLRVAPPGDIGGAVLHDGVVRLGASMVSQGLRIAAPVVASMFIVQLGTALVARSAPRVQIFALSFGIAVAAGTLALFVAAPSIVAALTEQVQHLPVALEASLGTR